MVIIMSSVFQTIKKFPKSFAAKRAVALLLTLTLSFSLVAMPVQASSVNDPAVAARKLLGELKEAMSEASVADEPVSEPEAEAEAVKRTVQSITLDSPKMTLTVEPDGEGILSAVSAASGEGGAEYIDWMAIGYDRLSELAQFDESGSLVGGIVHFMLNNNKYQTMTLILGGKVCRITGIMGFDELNDADHDRVCDACGRCTGGCTGDVKTYTAQDVASRDEKTGLLYDGDGNEIGCTVTVKMPVLCEPENGEPYTELREQTFDNFYSVSVDGDGLCNFCGFAGFYMFFNQDSRWNGHGIICGIARSIGCKIKRICLRKLR